MDSISKISRMTIQDTMLISTRQMGGVLVTLIVGPNMQRFYAHRDLLCSKTRYFDRMFNGHFEEAEALEAHFPDDDPHFFDVMLKFIYTSEIPMPNGVDLQNFGRWPHYIDWSLRVFATADKYELPDLCDQVIDLFFLGIEAAAGDLIVDMEDVEATYSLTSDRSQWRACFSQMLAYALLFGDGNMDEDLLDELQEITENHKELFVDLLRGFHGMAGMSKNHTYYHLINQARNCWYHQHDRHVGCDSRRILIERMFLEGQQHVRRAARVPVHNIDDV